MCERERERETLLRDTLTLLHEDAMHCGTVSTAAKVQRYSRDQYSHFRFYKNRICIKEHCTYVLKSAGRTTKCTNCIAEERSDKLVDKALGHKRWWKIREEFERFWTSDRLLFATTNEDYNYEGRPEHRNKLNVCRLWSFWCLPHVLASDEKNSRGRPVTDLEYLRI